MANGPTSSGVLDNSQEVIIDSTRLIRKNDSVHMRTCDATTLPKNTGLNWDEVAYAQLTAQDFTEVDILDNHQQMSDSLFQVTPAIAAISVLFTVNTLTKLTKGIAAKGGQLMQQALEVKKANAYMTTLDSATTALPGTGTTLTSGHIDSYVERIMSNSTEPGKMPINVIAHGFQLKQLNDEIRAGVGTYIITTGLTADALQKGIVGMTVSGATLHRDNNVPIDATPDAKGGVHAKDAVVYVQGFQPRTYSEVAKNRAGAEIQYMYDDYMFGIRQQAWLFELFTTAPTPTS